MLGIHWHASETPFNGVLLAGRWWPALSGTWILPPLINFKNKRCQSWIPSDKTVWIRAWIMPVDSLISIEAVHTHCVHARIQNILSEGVVREDWNATKNGPPSAHQRNAIVDNGPPLNACWLGSFVMFRGSGSILLGNPIFLWFSGGPYPLSPLSIRPRQRRYLSEMFLSACGDHRTQRTLVMQFCPWSGTSDDLLDPVE